MFDSYKPSECAPSSGTCRKLHVDTCIPLGEVDLRTSCTFCLSVAYLKHAEYSGIGGVWHMIGVTGLLAPGLSCSGPPSFHKRLVDVETKCFSPKEAFTVTQAC